MKAKLLVLLAFGLLLSSSLAVAGSHDGTPGEDHGEDARDEGEGSADGHDGNATRDGNATDRRDHDRDEHSADDCQVEKEQALAEAKHDFDEAVAEAREDRDEKLHDPASDAEDRREAREEYNRSFAKAKLEYEAEVRDIEADHEDCLADVREREADEEEDRRGRPDREPGDFFDSARFVSFTPDGANDTLLDYTVRGVPVLDEARYLGDAGDRRVSLHGGDRVLEIRWGEDRVRVHDNPTGLMQFKAEDDEDEAHEGNATPGGFLFDFVDAAVITRTDDGARIAIDGRQAILVAPHAEWADNDTVLVAGFASLHLPVRGGLGEARGEHDDAIEEAIAARRVAAQVALGNAGVTGVAPGQNGSVDVLAFDDVEVSASGSGSPDDPFRVLVDAELDEGRTIAIEVADVQPGQGLDLAYYDVQDDGTRTQVVFTMADSLQDVLDPTDDEGQPEYWIVHDADGAQVLVSVPHWSIHEVTLAIGDFVTQPSVIAGAIAGVLGTAVAATAMLWPRRVKD